MPLAEARALWPAALGKSVGFEPYDPCADRQALRELAVWCQQFSPVAAIDDAEAPDCLLLDVTGCDHGPGEEGLATQACAALRRRGYWVGAVVADTIGSAWAVAHGGMLRRSNHASSGQWQVTIVPPGKHVDALRPLPVESLRLPGPAVQILHELSIHRVDQLLALPRATLPSRFGAGLLLRVDQALGAIPEMMTPEPLAEPLEACWEFEPPIADGRILTKVIDHLLERLLQQIVSNAECGMSPMRNAECGMRNEEEGEERVASDAGPHAALGVQRLLCSLKLVGRELIRFPVELLRPSASQRRIMELVRLQVERLRIPAEVTSVTVRAAVVAPIDFQQEELFGGSEGLNWRNEMTDLLERLSSRLGERAVLRPQLQPDAQPEYACRYEPWLSAATRPAPAPGAPSAPCRPAFLKRQPPMIAVISIAPEGAPRQFVWNERRYTVERSWGPERIETGWWREADVRRDYYLVETTTGERFWMFRDLRDQSWRLHGAFA